MNTAMGYNLIKRLIDTRSRSKEDLLDMCSVYYNGKNLTQSEYTTLVNKINTEYTQIAEEE